MLNYGNRTMDNLRVKRDLALICMANPGHDRSYEVSHCLSLRKMMKMMKTAATTTTSIMKIGVRTPLTSSPQGRALWKHHKEKKKQKWRRTQRHSFRIQSRTQSR
jgi:hypothetical protein